MDQSGLQMTSSSHHLSECNGLRTPKWVLSSWFQSIYTTTRVNDKLLPLKKWFKVLVLVSNCYENMPWLACWRMKGTWYRSKLSQPRSSWISWCPLPVRTQKIEKVPNEVWGMYERICRQNVESISWLLPAIDKLLQERNRLKTELVSLQADFKGNIERFHLENKTFLICSLSSEEKMITKLRHDLKAEQIKDVVTRCWKNEGSSWEVHSARQ